MTFSDPYRLYRALQAHGPYRAVASGEPLWVLSDHTDVASALLNARLASSPQGTARQLAHPGGPGHSSPLLQDILSRQIEVMNGPAHRRLRRTLSTALSQLTPDDLAAVVRSRIAVLLESVRGDDEFDFVARVAAPLPKEVLLDIMGLEPEEREPFSSAVQILLATLRQDQPNKEQITAGEVAVRSIVESADRWRARYAMRATNGVIGKLVCGAGHGPGMTTAELAANVILLFAAGHGTTTSLLGNAVYLRMLHVDATATRQTGYGHGLFVEEALRFESPIQSVRRTATAPVEIGSYRIESQEEVLLLLGAANRDPARFAHAEVFDPLHARPSNLAFGLGAHRCPGAKLARLQAELVLDAIDREPAALRCISAHTDWLSSASTRGLRSLHLGCISRNTTT